MKRAKILTTLLCATLAFGAPLFAQEGEDDWDALEAEMEQVAAEAAATAEAAVQDTEADQAEAVPPEELGEELPEEPVAKAEPMPMSEKPKRFFEIGIDVGVGVANNALGIGELLTDEIVLDFDIIRDKVAENGLGFALTPSPLPNVFFNLNFGQFLGLGIFTKVEGDINVTLGSALMDFLADGNLERHNIDGDALSISGGIFAEVGARALLHLDRWTFTASPSVFMPLVYIPKSSLKYNLNTDKGFALGVSGEINIYTPFSMKDMDVMEITNNISHAGFDLTAGAEFGLFDWLYVGGTANHIPIVPSTLTNLMTIKADALGISIKDPLSNPQMETNMDTDEPEYFNVSESVMRPLTFDVYAKWQLLDRNFLKLTLKPNLGFTAITASGVPDFNWGVQADLSVLFLSFHLGTGLNQGIWKHRLGFGLNLRVVEFLAEASLQSTDFQGSFNASGLGVNLGFRFGF
jgi:hypothetical protein